MNKFRLEENLLRIPLIIKIIKNNIFNHKNIKFKDYKYGQHNRQYYRVFKGKDKTKSIIVFIHGGGWWHGSPKMCSYVGKYFCKRGYTVVLPTYRLVPKFKYPTQINDVFKAIKDYSTKNKYIKKRGIILIGFSAGGELAANIVFNKEKQKEYKVNRSILKGFISLSGVLDFNKCTTRHSKKLISNYIGADTVSEEVNPIKLICKNVKTPVLCIHGERDPLIDVNNSYSFIDKIKFKKGYGKVFIIKRKHHSDITTLIMGKGEQESKEIFEFIKKL